MSESIDIGIKFDDSFDRQLRRHEPLFDPVSKLILHLGETWISGDDIYCEVRAVGFFTQLLTLICDLDAAESETAGKIQLYDETYLSLRLESEKLTIEHRYNEAAIDNPDERLGIGAESTADFNQVALEALEGAEQVNERIAEVINDTDQSKLYQLNTAIEAARERFGEE
ncbi:MAG: hypothetical protein ACI9LV_000778 [Candidatus Nanohaloarchaea archaeon]|jgi:hypothetical protein